MISDSMIRRYGTAVPGHMWSRSSRSTIVSRLSGRKFIDGLLVLQRKLGGRPVVILTDEMAVHTVSKYREAIAKPDSSRRFSGPIQARKLALTSMSVSAKPPRGCTDRAVGGKCCAYATRDSYRQVPRDSTFSPPGTQA